MKCVSVPDDNQHVRFPDGNAGGVELVQFVARSVADRRLLARLAALVPVEGRDDCGVRLTQIVEAAERFLGVNGEGS